MGLKSDAQKEAEERKRSLAIKTINEFQKVSELQEYALRLNRFPDLLDLIPLVQERIRLVIAKNEIARNDRLLPEPLDQDHERVPLRDLWVEAAAVVGSVGPRTLQMVRRYGFLKAMLLQLENIDDIGDNRFVLLRENNLTHLSAEFLMRKYYSDKLNEQQKGKIDQVLNASGISRV